MKKIVVITVGKWVKLFLVLVLLVGGLICWRDYHNTSQQAVLVSTIETSVVVQEEKSWTAWLSRQVMGWDLQGILDMGWSVLTTDQEASGQSLIKGVLDEAMAQLLGFDVTNPYGQLGAGMAALSVGKMCAAPQEAVGAMAEEDYFLGTAAQVDDWHFEMRQLNTLSLPEDTMVLLYHTHNAETYQPTDGVSKRPGENAGVSTAADVLQQALEQKYGLKTLHSKVLHDYPDWSRSYINSLATAKDLLVGNPQVQAVFDVHRDAGFTSKAPTTVSINGQKAAKIMIVVGANHEGWKSNLAFAQALEDKSNALYPELVRSIRIVQASRYNQQVHPHALILEIGSDLNTQEEANYALECFAQVIAEVLLQDQAG